MCADKRYAGTWMTGRRRAAAVLAAGSVLVLAVAGCASTDKMPTSSIPEQDYKVRHPILLSETTNSIDVFPSIGEAGLDRHTAKQIFTFAQDYQSFGHGPVLALLPAGTSQGVKAGIKAALAAAGVTAPLNIEPYPAGNTSLASPVRLSFTGLKAKVGDKCGQWPRDVASGNDTASWNNQSYYNFGCAQQSIVAAQTADPRDLVTPRGEEPADTQMQSRGIEKVRDGKDPTTQWVTHNSNIGSVGSN